MELTRSDAARDPVDKYDRIRRHILEEQPLTDAKEMTLARQAQQIYPIIVEYVATKDIVDFMVSQKICLTNQAYRLIQETEKIFGRVRHVTKDGRRALLVELLMEAIRDVKTDEKASPVDKAKAIDRLIDKLAKLDGLYESEGHMTTIYNNLLLNPIQIAPEVPMMEGRDTIPLEFEHEIKD